LIYVFLALAAGDASAGIRDPGKYNGVIVFDRWDSCYLSSGLYLMCIPERLKETVRSHEGKSVVLGGSEVFQPENPGDGRLDKFTFVGFSQPAANCGDVEQLKLNISLSFDAQGHPALKLAMTNDGAKPVIIQPGELALTVLSRKVDMDPNWRHFPHPSDGPSYAIVTRHEFFCMDPKQGRHEVLGGKRRAAFKVRGQTQQMKNFKLASNETKDFIVDFTLTEGEYDIFVGYGGGVHASLSVASNLIAVDVAPDDTATFPKIKRLQRHETAHL